MRILLIRHGDPDYVNDTVTEKGHREAQLLSGIAERLRLGDCYVSPLGRAQDTASYSLKKTGKTAQTLDWLMEFPRSVDINGCPELQRAYPDTRKAEGNEDEYRFRICWDMAPAYLAEHPEYMDREGWRHSLVAEHSEIVPMYDEIIQEFDELLAKYGYVREGMCYRVERENVETVTFFCHFGISCVLLSHLWNVSPFVLWHGLVMAPTSVTEVTSEEREQGVAYFRGQRIGDVSHLYMGGEEPAFAARFCEVYSNQDQRH